MIRPFFKVEMQMANRHIKTGTCSVEAWFPAQSYTSSKQSTYINMTGCVPSRFQKRQTQYVGSETAGPWCPGREPYLGGSVKMGTIRRELLILIFTPDALYLNG